MGILVVEDDDLHFDFLGSFSPSKFDVVFAEDLDESRAKCEGREIRLVVISVDRVSDYEALLRELKQAGALILGVGPSPGEGDALVDRAVEPGEIGALVGAARKLLRLGAVDQPRADLAEPGGPRAGAASGLASTATAPLVSTTSYMDRLRARLRGPGAGERSAELAPKGSGTSSPPRPTVVSLGAEVALLRKDVALLADRLEVIDGVVERRWDEERGRREELERRIATQGALLESVRLALAEPMAPHDPEAPTPVDQPGDPLRPRPSRPTRRGFFGPGTAEIPTVVARHPEAAGAPEAEDEDANTVVETIPQLGGPLPDEGPRESSIDDLHTAEVRPDGDLGEATALTTPGLVPLLARPAEPRAESQVVVLADVASAVPMAPSVIDAARVTPRSSRWLYIVAGAMSVAVIAVIVLLLFLSAGEDEPAEASTSALASSKGDDRRLATAGGLGSGTEAAPAGADVGADSAGADGGADRPADGATAPPVDAVAPADLSAREIARRRAWARRVLRKARLRIARKLLARGKYVEARVELTKALKMRDDRRVRELLAESHQRVRELWPAVHHLTKALAHTAKKASLQQRIAAIYLKLGKRSRACAALQLAAKRLPSAKKSLAKHCNR